MCLYDQVFQGDFCAPVCVCVCWQHVSRAEIISCYKSETRGSDPTVYSPAVTVFFCRKLELFVFLNAAALQALKRKKRYEKQLQQIDGTLSTIEFQREALENASTNTEVLRVMGDAAKALKTAHKSM